MLMMRTTKLLSARTMTMTANGDNDNVSSTTMSIKKRKYDIITSSGDGIGNDLFTMLWNIINEHIETYAPGEEAIRRAIPALKQVIEKTTAMRDSWDSSDDGKQLKTLT